MLETWACTSPEVLNMCQWLGMIQLIGLAGVVIFGLQGKFQPPEKE